MTNISAKSKIKNQKYYALLSRLSNIQRKPVDSCSEFLFDFWFVILPFDIWFLNFQTFDTISVFC